MKELKVRLTSASSGFEVGVELDKISTFKVMPLLIISLVPLLI